MSQLEIFGNIEKRLWKSADSLRAGSALASNEYFLPVMGIIFLRHAYSRFKAVKAEIEKTVPTRGGKARPLTPEDFHGKSAIYLDDSAQFPALLNLSEQEDFPQAIINAMKKIEEDYPSLAGVLPKDEYRRIPDDVLRGLLRAFDDPELDRLDGDVMGRVYEYFLTEFADQGAHDNGEFFTPISIVQTIVNTIEPNHGTVVDPAAGSGGMFVQSAHFVERQNGDPNAAMTFIGQEKNETTIRLARMNLSVHGLAGEIRQGITYYDRMDRTIGKADFVMANPPFNVDEVDADKIKNDPRLPFGLPGVNKESKVSNGNYLWISYFYSYLNDRGRAGFVMSSQASSAGNKERDLRKSIVQTGHVDVMIAIRSGFFYTRSVPCELWFFDKAKPENRKEKVLMIDARSIYRQVTRSIYDFSPEQQQDIAAIVWLYRGEKERFNALVEDYLITAASAAARIFDANEHFLFQYSQLWQLTTSFVDAHASHEQVAGFQSAIDESVGTLRKVANEATAGLLDYKEEKPTGERPLDALHGLLEEVSSAAEPVKRIQKLCETLVENVSDLVQYCEKELDAKKDSGWETKKVKSTLNALSEAKNSLQTVVDTVRKHHRHGQWLLERFPYGRIEDVEGLVRVTDREEIEANDWSLTPGRYVGVAPDEVDPDFDFVETMAGIQQELQGLDAQAMELNRSIQRILDEVTR